MVGLAKVEKIIIEKIKSMVNRAGQPVQFFMAGEIMNYNIG